MTFAIQRLAPEDYDEAYALWERTPGMHLHSLNNTYGGISSIIENNPFTCFKAIDEGGHLIATALGATDGRKGYLYHVAVAESHRGQGIGSALIKRVLDTLKARGITTIGLFVAKNYPPAKEFWLKQHFKERHDVEYLDIDL